MSSRMSAAAVMETLEEETSPGSAVVRSFALLTSFARTAGSAAVLRNRPGLADLLVSVSVSLSAADEVIEAVSQWRSRRDLIPVYHQFRILFYTVCHREYLASLDDELKGVKPGPQEETGTSEHDYNGLTQRTKEILDAEASYILCVNPADTELLLFKAYDQWLAALLPAYGMSSAQTYNIVQQVSKKARERLKIFLAQQTPDAQWMRDYLALSRQEHTAKVLTTLAATATSLSEWIANDSSNLKRRHHEAWVDYRRALSTLPDQRDTMFAENFGVRKVFVAPQGSYMVIGSSAKSYMVNNVPRLLGALLSERLPAGDLRILCGGPGSGKSTVCRMLASELTKDQAIHPIFLRLRRMKEGADISAYVEESLRNEGVIDRLSDLRDLPNLVLILDGFDELVMASRARLRHFFNVLREELTTGPLRSARAIVSGRDTLFPNGDGLPVGAHVLTLLPFDTPRVITWGGKWRTLHKNGPGSDFKPDQLLPDGKASSETPLQHLASWPLTLHLLARAHTKGILDLSPASGQNMEKAFLYRSIMADTAQRQMTQAEGKGRFDRSEMQRFMRLLAWEMYSRETDSLDFEEVIPLVQQFYPGATETEVMEVTDVAIVNAPELTKGEQTGCEFVHKSFSEYLAAEHIAETVERAAFKAAQFGTDEPTWRMSAGDATAALASIFASRLITPEVQEMLEPMLGCIQKFFSGIGVEDVRTSSTLHDGLARIIEHLEMMLGLLAKGEHLETISRLGSEGGLAGTTLEAFANYCAGLMIVGTAAARRASRGTQNPDEQIYFNGQPVLGGFWRCIGLLAAGGLGIDDRMGARLFNQMTLGPDASSGTRMSRSSGPRSSEKLFNESSFPIKLIEFRRIQGYDSAITSALDQLSQLTIGNMIASIFYNLENNRTASRYLESVRFEMEERDLAYNYARFIEGGLRDLDHALDVLGNSGLSIANSTYRFMIPELDRLSRMAIDPPVRVNSEEYYRELDYMLRRVLQRLDLVMLEDRRSHTLRRLLENVNHEMYRSRNMRTDRNPEVSQASGPDESSSE